MLSLERHPLTSRKVSESVEVGASAATVFDLLADVRQHAAFDGSATVKGTIDAPPRLFKGAKFRMSMRLIVPYRTTNEVVEFEEGRLIAWRHFGHHIWRYELEDLGDSRCRVTETFDFEGARSPLALELANAPARNRSAIKATLLNLQLRFGAE